MSSASSTTSTLQTSASGASYLTGTISGIDTESLINAAVTAKLVPATRLSDQISTNTNIISAYQDLQTKIAAVQADVNLLQSNTTGTDTNALTAKEVTYLSSSSTTATNLLTATVDSTAQTGSHKVVVSQLAESLTVTSAEQNSASAALGYTGTFDIGEAGETAATISVSATSTLQSVADSINATTSTSGVKADILQSADGKYKLVISGNDTAKSVSVSNVTGTNVLNNLGVTDTSNNFVNVAQPAQQAQVIVDGTTINSDTNKLSDVLTGFTLDLTNADPATTITVTVGNNTDGVTTALQNFVKDYNTLHDSLVNYQAVNSDGSTPSGAYLYNDPLTRSLTQNISALLTNTYGTGSNYTSLGSLGITFDTSNDLVLDTSTLTTALTNNFSDVQSFFASNSTSNTVGFGDTMYSALDSFGNTDTGSIAQSITSLQSQDTDMQSQVNDLQTAADTYQQTLIDKYAQLETQMQTSNIQKEQIDAILKGSTPDSSS